ncbi:hypothetical protein METH_16395 [Leisingera methylohalidivorans DSM 14336]|uniref:Uncharacterized protein n=1 Tax=Leisingera methylohalidivorans DSM 14336 TaxID=999552 RepID=V9W1Z5_9RHOB|nr:hypothetical protein METH_16395 [Leisingera methylohalidivorans DSM 14336]
MKFLLTFLLMSFSGSQVSADLGVKINIETTLGDMGYQEVELRGCRLSFGKEVLPSSENNFFRSIGESCGCRLWIFHWIRLKGKLATRYTLYAFHWRADM